METTNKIYKSFKTRLFPTQEQEELMWKHIGSCRFVWNYMLNLQQERHKSGERHLTGFDMIKQLIPLKNDGVHDWLYDVSNISIQIVCRDLEKAYNRFFKNISKFPKFKSRKHSKSSFSVRADSMFFGEDEVKIEKLGKIKFQTNYNIPLGRGIKFANPRISFIYNKWILSFVMECENQTPQLTNKSLGIDLGIKTLAVASFGGEKIEYQNINKSKRVRNLEKKRKHICRTISRKYHTNKSWDKSNGIVKYESILRNIESKLSNIRRNYTHQITHELVSMLPCRVVMEDLNVSGMLKNRYLSKSIAKQNFFEFIRQMKYKCEWNGIEFIQANRFYPSSKTCSACGTIKSDLKLSDRVLKCECGLEIDRDFNAALNLERYDMPELTRLPA